MFTSSSAEVEWARGKTQDDRHLLALLVWLKAYQWLGYFPKLADVSAVVAEHVRGVLGLPGYTVGTARAAPDQSRVGPPSTRPEPLMARTSAEGLRPAQVRAICD
ncbi:hypothetical protein [Actinoallomurus sp. NPDC050550]|uniref:hypothetical protein n=1 Tax=Actinoallomurus sp. NPDC050550 TaxID=3154937 RepID=UPI0033FE6753